MIRFAIALLVGCTAAQHNTAHGSLWLASNVLILCDYSQTVWASNNGRWDRASPDTPGMVLAERNPLLGERPSVEFLSAVIVADIVVNTAVLALPLPDWVKTAWFGSIATVETYMVTTNNYHGVCGLGDWSPGRLRIP